MSSVLIIGGDSLIGHALAQHLGEGGMDVTVTSRRRDTLANGRIHLDLDAPAEEWPPLPAADSWVLCAAVSKLADCHADPVSSHRINVEAPVALAGRAIDAGAQFVFLSSNQVFDGTVANRPAKDTVCPRSSYGQQKAEAERRMLELGSDVLVARLTKVLDPESALINGWIDALRDGQPIRPFRDMVLSPVPLSSVTRILERMIEMRLTGILQISGLQDISYEDAARHLARRIGADLRLIDATTAAEAGIPPEERPTHTTLDASRLIREIGEPVSNPFDVIDDIYRLSSR